MPRFVARAVIIEAHQYDGHIHTMPEAFRMAVRGHRVGGIIEIMTGDGVRPCKHEDWIVRGPDGMFSVQKKATFETWFEACHVEQPRPAEPILAAPLRRKAHG